MEMRIWTFSNSILLFVKIRPFRYGNIFWVFSQRYGYLLKSDRFGMEIVLIPTKYYDPNTLKSDRFGMEITLR